MYLQCTCIYVTVTVHGTVELESGEAESFPQPEIHLFRGTTDSAVTLIDSQGITVRGLLVSGAKAGIAYVLSKSMVSTCTCKCNVHVHVHA